MPSYSPDNLILKISLGGLLLHGLNGSEEMSGLFSFTLSCHADSAGLPADSFVGKSVGFSVMRQNGDWRDFHGIVSSFAPVDDGSGQPVYRLQVVPWLWCLTLSADCRIYQDKDVKEILTDVFQRHGFRDFDFSGLSGSYAKRGYCVQYNETAFNFVSRLMEDEGIFYWFRHEKSRHVLMLGDSPEAYEAAGDGVVAFRKDPRAGDGEDLLTSWKHEYSLTTGFFSSTDYDRDKPDVKLEKKSGTVGNYEHMDKLEAYSFPAGRTEAAGVQAVVKNAGDTAATAGATVGGEGCCRTFSPGLTFTMGNHPDKGEVGTSFVLTRVSHWTSGSRQLTGFGSGGTAYLNSFSCVPAKLTVRPPRRTPVPVAGGVETAVVTGPSGEEIHTDELGRIKIQFHWDRLGKRDEKSSCWVRVAQPLAGSGWGAVALPRVGQEVVVSFVNGSPDRPLVTGALYNGLNAVPYGLPADKSKTVFRTRSTPKGSEGNELTFDDKKDGEAILLHGERDLTITVKNDAFETVDNNSEQTIKGESKRTIEKKEDVTATVAYTLKSAAILLAGSSGITLTGGAPDSSGNVKQKGNRLDFQNDAGRELLAVHGERDLIITVKNDASETVDKNSEQTIKGGSKRTIERSEEVAVTDDYTLKAKTITLEGDTNITLKVGGSTLELTPAGITVKAAKIDIKAPKIDVKADAMLTLDGGMVMIG